MLHYKFLTTCKVYYRYPNFDKTILELLLLNSDKLDKKDLVIEKMRSSGNGGQNVNKVETAVRIKHIPTGITVVSREERTQYSNKKIGIKKISNKLVELNRKAEQNKKMEVWESKSEIERGNPDKIFEGNKFKKL